MSTNNSKYSSLTEENAVVETNFIKHFLRSTTVQGMTMHNVRCTMYYNVQGILQQTTQLFRLYYFVSRI